MTAKELLYLLQITGEQVHSNEEFLRKIKDELNPVDYGYIIDRITKANERMPTDFQDSHYYDMISDAFRELELVVKKHKIIFRDKTIPAKPVPVFGTVSLKGYNAFVTLPEDPLIGFNNELLVFTERLLRIYTIEHWLAAKNQLTQRIEDVLTRNFIDLLVCYYTEADPAYVLPIEACNEDNWEEFEEFNIPKEASSLFLCIYDATYQMFSEDVKTSAYLWVVAHEYAHLLLGHLETGENRKASRFINDIPVEETYFSWKDEFDADYLAASIVIDSENTYYKASGIYLALMCLKISGFGTESNGKASHPPANQRLDNIMEIIKREPRYVVACKNIDTVIVPKFAEFRRFLYHVDSNDLRFSNAGEIQKYIYTKYQLTSEK